MSANGTSGMGERESQVSHAVAKRGKGAAAAAVGGDGDDDAPRSMTRRRSKRACLRDALMTCVGAIAAITAQQVLVLLLSSTAVVPPGDDAWGKLSLASPSRDRDAAGLPVADGADVVVPAAAAAGDSGGTKYVSAVPYRGGEEEPLSISSLRNHPMLSIKPLAKSLHPKWKLWTEMSESEQTIALDRAGTYLKKYGQLITKPGSKSLRHGDCELDPSIGSTGHKLCLPKPEQPCSFFSFGINDDPSYDRELANTWGCRGFAADPTVHHPSKLHELVTYHNIGATTLMANEERLINKGGAEEWWDTSMPKLRFFLGLEHIDVVKLDCEGCEHALARDILREDPTFLHHVDQMNIETHVTKTWLESKEHVYYFGVHFALMEEAGFKLEWSSIFGCSKRHEITGCMPELEKYGFPCGYEDWPGHPKVVIGRSCHDFLWKRYGLTNERKKEAAPQSLR